MLYNAHIQHPGQEFNRLLKPTKSSLPPLGGRRADEPMKTGVKL